MGNKIDLQKMIKEDAKIKRAKKKMKKVITLERYIEDYLIKDPSITQNSSARLFEMIMSYGVEDLPNIERLLSGEETDKRYMFFAETLFGVEEPSFEIVNFFNAGAKSMPVGKKLLLLVGPTASGKSSIVNLIKKGLERYKIRPVFAIKDCPLHEEPLHALPRYLQKEISEKLGIKIVGDLCPQCRYRLENEYTEPDGELRWRDFPVETFTFSVQGTRGIGSFEPSGEMTADINKLCGRENVAISNHPDKGPSHPFAYDLRSGELEKGNRGIVEPREMPLSPPEVLRTFISVAAEGEMKVEGSPLPHISVDEVIIGHTNLTAFKKFYANLENEALHSRIKVIPVPHSLRVQDEVRIYKKLIEKESDFNKMKNCHIAPGSLEIAAIFAVMTRLTKSNITKISLLDKVKAYNGEDALSKLEDSEKKSIDIHHLIAEGRPPDASKREGMFGVDPRDIMDALNTALMERERGCLTPKRTIKALRKMVDRRMGLTPEEIDEYKNMLSDGEKDNVINEWYYLVKQTVKDAFLEGYKDLAKELFNRYIEEAALANSLKRKFVRGQTMEIKRDDLSGKPKEPDYKKILRPIEERAGISASQADGWRGEILADKGMNPEFSYETYAPLRKPINDKLFADCMPILTIILGENNPKNEDEKKRKNDLYNVLKKNGHCEEDIKEYLEEARKLLMS